jgi:hypothetical protein
VFYSLEEWARTGPSRPLQGAARRPRLTSLAMMSRRVVERRRVMKKWWAPLTNAAQSGANPVHRAPGRHGAGSKRKRELARSRNVHQHVKGSSVTRVTLRTAM